MFRNFEEKDFDNSKYLIFFKDEKGEERCKKSKCVKDIKEIRTENVTYIISQKKVAEFLFKKGKDLVEEQLSLISYSKIAKKGITFLCEELGMCREYKYSLRVYNYTIRNDYWHSRRILDWSLASRGVKYSRYLYESDFSNLIKNGAKNKYEYMFATDYIPVLREKIQEWEQNRD